LEQGPGDVKEGNNFGITEQSVRGGGTGREWFKDCVGGIR